MKENLIHNTCKIRKVSNYNTFSFAKYLTDMKLSDLEIGQQATIIDFSKDEISIKLMEMGLVPGEIIYIEKFAPLGDPMSIAVAGYSLSLRINEAENINVEILY